MTEKNEHGEAALELMRLMRRKMDEAIAEAEAVLYGGENG